MANLENKLGNAPLTPGESYLKKAIRKNKAWIGTQLGFMVYDAVIGIYDMAEGKYGWGTLMLAFGVGMGLFARSDYRKMKDNKEALENLKKNIGAQYSTIDDAVKPEHDEGVLKL